jgi:hypothetical protein
LVAEKKTPKQSEETTAIQRKNITALHEKKLLNKTNKFIEKI